jgi:hypothetical protein
VIGVRRSLIPPLVDSYQDMVFVLFGPKTEPEKVGEPNFMDFLDELASAPVPPRLRPAPLPL